MTDNLENNINNLYDSELEDYYYNKKYNYIFAELDNYVGNNGYDKINEFIISRYNLNNSNNNIINDTINNTI